MPDPGVESSTPAPADGDDESQPNPASDEHPPTEETAAAPSDPLLEPPPPSHDDVDNLHQDEAECCGGYCGQLDSSTYWMLGSFLTLVALLVFGTIYFHLTEDGWSLEDAWFFSVVTLTTVGYGVLTPSTELNRGITLIYVILAVTAGAVAVGTITAQVMTALLESADRAIAKGEGNKIGKLISVAWFKMRRMGLVSLLLCTVFLFCGTGFLCALEGWSFLDSLYFSIITMSTVGYGDMSPAPGHRLAASFYILLATAVFAFSIAAVLAAFVTKAKKDSARRFM